MNVDSTREVDRLDGTSGVLDICASSVDEEMADVISEIVEDTFSVPLLLGVADDCSIVEMEGVAIPELKNPEVDGTSTLLLLEGTIEDSVGFAVDWGTDADVAIGVCAEVITSDGA